MSRAKPDPEFAGRVRELMALKRLRPSTLADLMGVNKVTVSRWRRGELPEPFYLSLLAEHLGTTVEHLKTGAGAQMEGEPIPLAVPDSEPLAGEARQVAHEAIRAMCGRSSVPSTEAIGWVIRVLEAGR